MRKFNEATNNTNGELYEVGDYNVFVRSKPTARLDEIITFKQQIIDPRKCASDLAKILDNMHNENMFVRFIVPQNITFMESVTGQNEVMFEEFNTITFVDKNSATKKYLVDSGKESEQVSSAFEHEKNVENSLDRKKIQHVLNTKKSYTVANEI